MKSSSSHQVVVRQSSGSYQAFNMQSSGNLQAGQADVKVRKNYLLRCLWDWKAFFMKFVVGFHLVRAVLSTKVRKFWNFFLQTLTIPTIVLRLNLYSNSVIRVHGVSQFWSTDRKKRATIYVGLLMREDKIIIPLTNVMSFKPVIIIKTRQKIIITGVRPEDELALASESRCC